MLNKLKYIHRSNLRSKLNKRCTCIGRIVAYSYVWGSFGFNDGNHKRVLLKKVSVDDININHVWVKSMEQNNFKVYKKGCYIIFNALVSSYQKINGSVGIGLFDLKNIQIIESN